MFLPYGRQLAELRADLVMPEWVARARGIEVERHPRRVVELHPTGRSRRRVPVALLGFSEKDLEGTPGSRERRSRWPDREAARRSVLREVAALSVVRYLLGYPPERWDYIGTKRPRRSPFGRREYRRERERFLRMTARVGAPDAEAWLPFFSPFHELAGSPVGVAVELDSGAIPPLRAADRFAGWLPQGVYSGLIWVALVRGQAERVAGVLHRARVLSARERGICYPVRVYYLSPGWVSGEEVAFELVYEGVDC